jgi:hypothetical protein
MATKIHRVAILLFIAITTTFSTCKKGGLGCANAIYNFNLDIRAYPDYAEINVGDTIWLEITSPQDFTDLVSNVKINYANAANLGSAIGFGEFIGRDSVLNAANYFDYKLIDGIKVNNPFVSKIREYLFIENQNQYLFKLGIIPKQTGIFGIGLSNAANVYRKNDKCTKANFLINFNNTKQHYFLNPNINSSNTDTTKPSASYYFKVN